jgi:hypothetical protein
MCRFFVGPFLTKHVLVVTQIFAHASAGNAFILYALAADTQGHDGERDFDECVIVADHSLERESRCCLCSSRRLQQKEKRGTHTKAVFFSTS